MFDKLQLNQEIPMFMFKHRSNWLFVVAACAAFLAGCASGPRVRIDKDPAADLSSYRTFGFYERLPAGRAGYATLTTTRLEQATSAQLKQRGYTYEEATPQLRVNFFVQVADRQEIRSSVPGPAGFRRVAWLGYQDIETVQYKAGTLRIDIVDTKTNALVWQGVAEGKLSKEQMSKPDVTVDTVVAEIFSKFPGSPKG